MSLVFRDTILTNKGFEVSNKAALGKTQFSIVKAVSTDVDLTNYKIEDLKNLTSLPNEIESGSILDYDSPQNSISVIKINFDNSKFRDGYTVRAVGLYGKDNNGDVFLHSLSVSESPIVVPQVTGNVFDGLSHSIAIFSGDNKNMTVNLVQNGYATIHYVDDSISKISDTIKNDIQPKLDAKADLSDLNEAKRDLKTNIDSKQPLGNYASPDDVNNAKQDAISHSDSNKDNLQEQINDKQPTGDYATNEDLKNKLNQKQDAGSYLTTDEFNKYDLSINDGKLMYQGLPIITAVKPSNVSINILNNYGNPYINYAIKCDSGGASIDNYQILYKSNDDNDFNEISTESSTGNINNLISGKTYELKVNAKNKAGTSDYSEIIKYFTFDISNLNGTISFNDVSGMYIQTNLNVNTTYVSPYEGYKLKIYLGQSLGIRYDMNFNLLKNAPQGKPYTNTNGYLYILTERIIPFPNQNIPSIFDSSEFAHNHGGFFAYVGAEVIDNNGNSLGWHTSVLTI